MPTCKSFPDDSYTKKQMKKYRKKPVVIEAIQWDGSPEAAYCITHIQGFDGRRIYWLDPAEDGLLIDTLEGAMTANLGDWIIKGIKGEIYPCKPDIFEMTYEEV